MTRGSLTIMSCLIPSAVQRYCQDLSSLPACTTPATDWQDLLRADRRARAGGFTGRMLFGIKDVSRSSSVRVSSLPLYASCIRQPRPHASTAHGGPCCTACQSAFPTCTKT